MITTGSKWFFGLAAVSFVLAAALGWSTGGTLLGPITAGYWGGVGYHLGYVLLVSTGAAGSFLGLISVLTRDANPSALAELAGTDAPPAAVPLAHGSYWPVVGAFGAVMVVLGLVVSNVLFIAGFFMLLAVLVEWMVLAWSDKATGDPETNRLIRNRLMGPFEVPLAGFLLVGGSVAAFSRLLLTSSEMGAVGVAVVLGVAVLALGTFIATRPRVSPNAIAGVLTIVGLAIISAGVLAAARGERSIEHHEDHGGGTEQSPYTPAGTDPNTTTTAPGGQG